MFSDQTKKKLVLSDALTALDSGNQIQSLKAIANQSRPGAQSPNVVAQSTAPALSQPAHVTEVRATTLRTSDTTSTVTVTFKRNPNDYYFSYANVYVTGYKGNTTPTLVATGQSPVSFTIENTGNRVSVIVQANGNLGPAPLSTAPNTTLALDKSTLVSNTANTYGSSIPAGGTNQIVKYISPSQIGGDPVFTDTGSIVTYSGNSSVGGGQATLKFQGQFANATIGVDYANAGTALFITSGTSGFSGGSVNIGANTGTATSLYLKGKKANGVQGPIYLDVTNDGSGNGYIAIGGGGGTDNVLRMYQQGGGSNYVAVQAPSTGITSWTVTLPKTAPNVNGQPLLGNTDGTTLWSLDEYNYVLRHIPRGSATSGDNLGWSALVQASPSVKAPTSTEGVLYGWTTNTTTRINGIQFTDASNLGYFTPAVMAYATFQAKLGITTSIRHWIGISDTLVASAPSFSNIGQDDPTTLKIAAFRYSTNAGDTHWKAYVANGTASQVIDTGITPAANSQRLTILYNGSHYLFYIDRALVATASSNEPATSTVMTAFAFTDNLNTASTNTDGLLTGPIMVGLTK